MIIATSTGAELYGFALGEGSKNMTNKHTYFYTHIYTNREFENLGLSIPNRMWRWVERSNISQLEDLGTTRPAGPAGGLRPPVGLQNPNFEL